MDFTGTIISLSPTEQVSEKFSKREFVMSDKTVEYPQTILFECQQQRTSLLDNYVVGSLVKVHFNLRGRQWTNKEGVTKTFNTLVVWKIDKVGFDSDYEGAEQEEPKPKKSNSKKDEDDDLPF